MSLSSKMPLMTNRGESGASGFTRVRHKGAAAWMVDLAPKNGGIDVIYSILHFYQWNTF